MITFIYSHIFYPILRVENETFYAFKIWTSSFTLYYDSKSITVICWSCSVGGQPNLITTSVVLNLHHLTDFKGQLYIKLSEGR